MRLCSVTARGDIYVLILQKNSGTRAKLVIDGCQLFFNRKKFKIEDQFNLPVTTHFY